MNQRKVLVALLKLHEALGMSETRPSEEIGVCAQCGQTVHFGGIPLTLPMPSEVCHIDHFPALHRALSQLLAVEVGPLSSLLLPCSATPAGLLSPSLTHHSLLVLMRGS